MAFLALMEKVKTGFGELTRRVFQTSRSILEYKVSPNFFGINLNSIISLITNFLTLVCCPRTGNMPPSTDFASKSAKIVRKNLSKHSSHTSAD